MNKVRCFLLDGSAVWWHVVSEDLSDPVGFFSAGVEGVAGDVLSTNLYYLGWLLRSECLVVH